MMGDLLGLFPCKSDLHTSTLHPLHLASFTVSNKHITANVSLQNPNSACCFRLFFDIKINQQFPGHLTSLCHDFDIEFASL